MRKIVNMASNDIRTKRIKGSKKVGTLLDDRYEIKGVIGKGGFSIVYEAVNVHTHAKVAIKECTANESKERFLKEARVLKDFADEPSVVSVIDSFEDDDTAYIVMEYLDGVTLREFIKSNGRLKTKDTVELFSSVMKSISRLHSAGIIHRDISPDNLIYTGNRTLKLLDFGAAKNYYEPDVSKLVFKSSYSPPEQMDEKGEMGTHTDVYSLCATIYYCLTGKDPDDVISRLLLDEIRTPSSLGSDILPQAEKSLMKGLRLDGAKRLQSIEELQKELEAVYPILTEEEKIIIAKRKKRHKRIVITAAVCAIMIAVIIINAHKIEIELGLTETYSIVLDGHGMTNEEFDRACEDVQDRVDALTSGIYTWDVDNKLITCKIPYTFIGGKYFESQKYAVYLLSRPLVLSFVVPEGEMSYDAKYLFTDTLSQENDILNIERKDNITTINFSESAQNRLKDYLSQEGNTVYLAYDMDYSPFAYTEAVTVGDGESVKVDHSEDIFKDTEKFERLRLTREPFKGRFEESQFLEKEHGPDDKVKWEDPDSTYFSGVYQKNPGDEAFAEGPSLYLKYDIKSEDEEILADLHDFPISAQAVIKSRLEHMSKSYAIGIDKYNYWMVWIKIGSSKCWKEMIDLMGESAAPPEIGSRTGIQEGIGSIEAPVFLKDDNLDPVGLACSINDVDIPDIREKLKTIRNNDENVYLYVNNIPVAYTSIESAVASLDGENRIVFDHWNSSVTETFDWGSYSMAEFIEGFYRQSPIEAYKLRDDDMYYVDQNGSLTQKEPLEYFFRHD